MINNKFSVLNYIFIIYFIYLFNTLSHSCFF